MNIDVCAYFKIKVKLKGDLEESGYLTFGFWDTSGCTQRIFQKYSGVTPGSVLEVVLSGVLGTMWLNLSLQHAKHELQLDGLSLQT